VSDAYRIELRSLDGGPTAVASSGPFWMVDELHVLERARGTDEHWCATCRTVADSLGGDA
jgi:hypothetical protein